MDHPALIIYLIRQDLRFMQLIRLLEKEGRDMENYYPDLMKVVAIFMGLPEDKISDVFVEIYLSFMEMVDTFPITGNGAQFIPVAEKCYEVLRGWVEVEGK